MNRYKEMSLFYQATCFIQIDFPHEGKLITKMRKHSNSLEKIYSPIKLTYFPNFCRKTRLRLKTRIRNSRIRSNSLKTRRLSREACNIQSNNTAILEYYNIQYCI